MYVETEIGGKKLQVTVDTGADKVYMAKEIADEISLPYKKEKGYVKGVNAKSLPIHGVVRGTDIQVGPWRGKVDITVAPLDDLNFYLGMDFLDKVKGVIVPHTSTLIIPDNGRVHAIPIKREAHKEKVLPALQFSERREEGCLATLTRDEGPTGDTPQMLPRKLTPRRRRARTRMGRKRAKDRCAEELGSTIQVESTPPADETTQGPSIRRPNDNEDVAGLGGGGCHGPPFRRVLECPETF